MLAILMALCAIGLALFALLRPQLERARLRRLEVELVDLDQDVTKLCELAKAPQRREIMAHARKVKEEKLSAQDQLIADAAAALQQQTGEVGDARKLDPKDQLRVIAKRLP